jgi:hypothetical protein
MALWIQGDAKIGVSIHQNVPRVIPDRLSGLEVRQIRTLNFARRQHYFLASGAIVAAYKL